MNRLDEVMWWIKILEFLKNLKNAQLNAQLVAEFKKQQEEQARFLNALEESIRRNGKGWNFCRAKRGYILSEGTSEDDIAYTISSASTTDISVLSDSEEINVSEDTRGSETSIGLDQDLLKSSYGQNTLIKSHNLIVRSEEEKQVIETALTKDSLRINIYENKYLDPNIAYLVPAGFGWDLNSIKKECPAFPLNGVFSVSNAIKLVYKDTDVTKS